MCSVVLSAVGERLSLLARASLSLTLSLSPSLSLSHSPHSPSNPYVLGVDEPTSGLDAAAASGIMALLRRLASDSDVIIVTSLHQPSSRIFHSFDQVCHLSAPAVKSHGSLP